MSDSESATLAVATRVGSELPVASETFLPGCLQDGVHGENLEAGDDVAGAANGRRSRLCSEEASSPMVDRRAAF